MKNRKKQQSGFIVLFFVLGISFTFLTWISLSSEIVFEYMYIKSAFINNRDILNDVALCSNAFINNLINSRYNLDFSNREYSFYRNSYFSDQYICHIKDIYIIYDNGNIDEVLFILGDFSFKYKFKNGFINYFKTFNLF